MSILKSYETTWAKRGGKTKKCRVCQALLQDGDKVIGELIQKEKLYPVKGIMRFNTWKFRHIDCAINQDFDELVFLGD